MDPRPFFSELKRRNVYKVAIAYAVVGWVLIQVATQVFPFFEIPNWAVRLVVLAIIIGFPIALVLAWAFETTPAGIKRTEDVDLSTATRAPKKHAWVYVVAIGAAISVGLFFVGRYTAVPRPDASAPRTEGTGSPVKSIAVLPFENLSDDKSNAYFAEGIQDEILTRLAKVADLKVISRTSTQKFKSAPENLPQIAKQLGVMHILEGSVQKAADQVRVNVQLIKADHDAHLWAETFDRKLTDIFAVESEIAEKIAASLTARLTGSEHKAIANVPTQNSEAYDNYLRAVTLLNRQGVGQLTQARHALERAIQLDPNYAQAWARLALTESEIYFGGALGEGEHTPAQLERARRAAETAIRLQPELSDSHLGLASFHYYCLKDYDRALVELSEARRLAPNDAYVIFATGLVKRRQGKLHEALRFQHEAAVLDPRNSDMWVNLARTYGALRDFDRAREMFDRAIALAPDEPDIVAQKADLFITQGKLDVAEAELKRVELNVLGDAYGTTVNLCILRRQFDRAMELLARSIASPETPRRVRAADLVELGALQLVTNNPAARATSERARAELLALRAEGDTSPDLTARLIGAAACLGDRATVDRESEALLRQQANDHFDLPRSQVAVAAAYAFLKDADRAIPLLAAALAAPSDITPTPALLRIQPAWDPIRHDPRFEALVQKEVEPQKTD